MSKQHRRASPIQLPSHGDDFLLENPDKAAQQLDALLYFIHKRYSKSSSATLPDLGKFLIIRAEVIFSNKLRAIQIQKRPDKNVLQILAPGVAEEIEEKRRIFLLNEFSELIIKCQKQAYIQIREMVLRITDSESHETLVKDFERYKSEQHLAK